MLQAELVQNGKKIETVEDFVLRNARITYEELKYRDLSNFTQAEKLANETLLELKVFMQGKLEEESHTAGYYHLKLIMISTEVIRSWLKNNPKTLRKGSLPSFPKEVR